MGLENVLALGEKKLKEILAGKQEAGAAKKNENPEEGQKKVEETPAPQKTEEELKAEEQSEDSEEELLEKPEDQLSEEEKQKLEEVKSKRNGEPTDKQLARKLRKAEKKISKMYGKLQDMDRAKQNEADALSKQIAELRKEIAIAKQPIEESSALQAEEARILQEIEEDQNKPYAERREMTKEEWETWFDEDPQSAQRWVTKNENRRIALQQEAKQKAELSEKAEEFLTKQAASVKRLIAKYPNTRPEAKALELKAKGLNQDEIHEFFINEYPEYTLVDKIVSENPEWVEDINFGDRVTEELEKRLKEPKQLKKETSKMYTEEDVAKIKEEAIKMEAERRASVDESNGSTISAHRVIKPLETKSEKLNKLEALYQKAGIDPSKAKARMAERSRLGYSQYSPEEDKG